MYLIRQIQGPSKQGRTSVAVQASVAHGAPETQEPPPRVAPRIQVLSGKGQELEVSPLQPQPLPQPSQAVGITGRRLGCMAPGGDGTHAAKVV